MKTADERFQECDALIDAFEKVTKHPIVKKSKAYYVGVDLGTACVVVVVLDETYRPVAGAYQYADVVRDGMVVDYIGAVRIVREMKEHLEEELRTELLYAAAAIPPGTAMLDSGVIKNVVQAAGFELTRVLDEPTAANGVLHIKNGAVVDVGGGTTGISILKDGVVTEVIDEPTGGTHFTLVGAGALHMEFAEAELYKRDPKNHKELLPVLKPTIEKVADIIKRCVEGHHVEEIYLVGGTCCLTGIEDIIEKYVGIPTYKPKNPMFVTPLGIAKSCTNDEIVM